VQIGVARGPSTDSQSLSDKPLIYNVTWKSSIYLLVSLLIHYLEHLIDFWRQTGGLVAGNEKLLAESCGRISGRSRSCCSR